MIDTEALRKKIIELAIQGKLTRQLPEDGNAEELYAQIQEEKAKLIKEGKIKKEKSLPEVSDNEVPFEIPENWKWVRVADIAFLSSGKPYEETEEGQLYIKVSDMNLPENESQIVTSTHFVDVKNDGIIPVNSIIFPKRGGAIATNKKRMIIQNPVFVDLNTMGMTVILADIFMYIKYWFDTLKLDEIQNGTTIPQVNNKDIYPLILPLPPVEEQKRIVEIIDGVISQIDIIDEFQQQYEYDREILKEKIIDAGICGKLTNQLPEDGNANDLYAQIQKEKAKLIKDGKIKKEKPLPTITDDEIPFDIPENWKWVRLGNLGANVPNAFADGPFGSNLKREHYTSEKQVRIIQLSNVGIEGWKDDNEKYTTYEHLKSIQRSEVKAGDIVIAKMMPAGRSIVVPDISNAYVLSSDCVKFVPNSLLDTNYLRYAINSNIFHDQVLQDVHGIGRERTSLSNLKRYLLPIPPIEEQKRIVSIIEAIFIQLAK